MTNIEQLAWALDVVASQCPHGIDSLIGDAPPPTRDDLICAATWRPSGDTPKVASVAGGKDPLEPIVDRLMKLQSPLEAVGWEMIVMASQMVREYCPKDWAAYALHVTLIDDPNQWRSDEESILEKIAQKCGLSPRTVSRRRRSVPVKIARYCYSGIPLSLMRCL